MEAIVNPRPESTPAQPQGLYLDKGYDYDEMRELMEAFGYTAPTRPHGKMLTRWEKRAASYLAMLHLASGIIS
ncbi:hypothetical protein MKFW12EY_44710 (plasmid) [Methylomonas koyamae]|nr:hypothetical protein MKFW12EY_44710 [Methylomonas koyamae]